MSEHTIELDEPVMDEQGEELRRAVERAERAEAALAQERRSHQRDARPHIEGEEGHARTAPEATGVEALRADSMMAHLLDSLAAHKDIGHYGRLVFAMVARHFLSDEEVIAQLTQDADFSAEQATLMLRQVEGRDYNPPRRERILEWQELQDFPILPDAHDPDGGNVYRTLRFPTKTYAHIEEYQEEKMASSG